ncbi:hypothetical protein HPB48_003749 [Haemaphysalis longicornis]|uniref:Uncharacterized protein n=1 Tax=Haemaphysalis longicornis TaxID=44386 RepID=A0A9J6FFI3_HAELO|nr:hypothetical protein HPB48_003749 [Haemaphysalis longicornis]
MERLSVRAPENDFLHRPNIAAVPPSRSGGGARHGVARYFSSLSATSLAGCDSRRCDIGSDIQPTATLTARQLLPRFRSRLTLFRLPNARIKYEARPLAVLGGSASPLLVRGNWGARGAALRTPALRKRCSNLTRPPPRKWGQEQMYASLCAKKPPSTAHCCRCARHLEMAPAYTMRDCAEAERVAEYLPQVPTGKIAAKLILSRPFHLHAYLSFCYL